MVDGTSRFTQLQSLPAIKSEYTGEVDNFSKKIVRFACHILRVFEILFSSKPWGVIWEVKHQKQWKGELLYLSRPAAVFSEEITKNETYQELRKAYCIAYNKTELEAERELKRDLAKGMCHAKCLELIQAIRDDPEVDLEKKLVRLKLNKKRVSLLQVFEFFRDKFQYRAEENLTKIREVVIQPKEIESFRIPEKEASRKIRNKIHARCDISNILLIRCWKNTKAHTFLLYTSEEKNHHYFFNSQGAGLFRFDTKSELISKFTSHVEAQSPYFKAETYWQLENF